MVNGMTIWELMWRIIARQNAGMERTVEHDLDYLDRPRCQQLGSDRRRR
jgi:hypothetical protein